MPFAGEFRERMLLPWEGEVVGGFRVESLKVEHVGIGPGLYEYPIEIVVSGKGGKEGVRRALKPLFDVRKTLFSGYGNPYQCSAGKMQVERLDAERYRVSSRGSGVRVHLSEELLRFLGYLDAGGRLSGLGGTDLQEALVSEYLREYKTATDRPTRHPLASH